jgi:hypothetical protein
MCLQTLYFGARVLFVWAENRTKSKVMTAMRAAGATTEARKATPSVTVSYPLYGKFIAGLSRLKGRLFGVMLPTRYPTTAKTIKITQSLMYDRIRRNDDMIRTSLPRQKRRSLEDVTVGKGDLVEVFP